jgi:predicted  nucleic acid-binding Zn-ribbon protein
VLLLLAAPARGEDTDLTQTISDLGSQAGDKEKIDTLGASKVEISQIRGWLTDATNAVQQSAAKKARRLFDLVRAQMRLVERLVAAAQLEHEAARLDREITRTRQSVASLKEKLDDRRAQLRASKQREGAPLETER